MTNVKAAPSPAATFDWDRAWTEVGGPPDGDGRINMVDRVVDRHVRDGRGDQVAIRWFGRADADLADPVDVSYLALSHRTSRFAGALGHAGHRPGDGVATLLGRVPEVYVSALGTIRAGGVYTPLFSAFGPDPIAQRLRLGRIRVLVTTGVLFRRKVRDLLANLPELRLVVIVDVHDDDIDALRTSEHPGRVEIRSFGRFLGEGHDEVAAAPTTVESPALLHFTSGTTGEPKGAVHVHGALAAHHATGRAVLDLHVGDTYWCTADPGWVTGTSYGMLAPLAHGVTMIVDEAELDARRWYRMLAEQRVGVFYTAPTAIRLLERMGADLAPAEFPELRLVASVGEPLDAAAVEWANEVFGVPVLDTWWQTETGAIMIANRLGRNVKPGSMGRPVPGIVATTLRRTPDGELERDADGAPIEADVDESGEIALRVGWPSMFRGYLDRDDRYRSCFVEAAAGQAGWYRSGDLARRDADGDFWFVGRGDDVIKTAGHLIGPFEVEAVLDAHPAVVESGVIGKPDEVAGNIIKAFVVLHRGYEPDDELRTQLVAHCRRHLGAAVSPREIEFADELPHTRSGKIMRRVIRARELGLDAGDTSTLQTAATTPTGTDPGGPAAGPSSERGDTP
ncbi:MAG: AMP-binding protein [Actinomycetota bacterium]